MRVAPCRPSDVYADDGVTPLCQHGVPMLKKAGKNTGKWRCRVRQRELDLQYVQSPRGRIVKQNLNIIHGIRHRLRLAGYTKED